MNSSFILARPAPTRRLRRLVLGTAFLLALALAVAPRITPVAAQEPKPAPTAPAKQPPAAKTVTITDGRSGGAKMTVELTAVEDAATKSGAAAPDTPGAEEASPAGAAKGTPGGRGTGRHGRVRIDGLGTDREFDSFGEFVHNEPEIAGMVVAIVTVVFLAPVLAIGLILWYRFRKTRMLNETMLKLAEKGIVPPAQALEALAGGKQAAMLAGAAATAPLYEQARQIRRRAAWSDLRKGVITGGIGLALTLYSVFDDRSPNGLGLVLLFIGIAYVVLWYFEERQLPPADAGGTSGSAPPSA